MEIFCQKKSNLGLALWARTMETGVRFKNASRYLLVLKHRSILIRINI